MWPKFYRDYKEDQPLIQEKVGPSDGIIGCEMHDLNGWGLSHHTPKKTKRGVIAQLLLALFGKGKE